jgi:Flp pilus assembly protein TadG
MSLTRNRKPETGNRLDDGNVIVELALVLPFLLLVVAGIVDVGLLYWEKHIITNASREGARAGARAGVSGAANLRVSQVEAVVQDYLNRFHLKGPDDSPIVLTQNGNFFYTWDLSSAPGTMTVELRDIPVKLMLLPNVSSLLGGGLGSDPVRLRAATTMAAEWTTAPLP